MNTPEKTFTTTFAVAALSADTVVVDGYEVDGDKFSTYTKDGVKHWAMDLAGYDQGVVIVKAHQNIEIDCEGTSQVPTVGGSVVKVVFTVAKPLRKEDLAER